MKRSAGLGLASLIAGLVAGCTLTSSTRMGDTYEIEPLEEGSAPSGVLVARVEGYPREIAYFVNGVHVVPDEEIAWWKDARIEIELKAGTYDVAATYLVRAFAGERTEYYIETSRPVRVYAGRETHLLAVIRKDWRGVPDREVTPFRVVDPDDNNPDDNNGRQSRGLSSSEPAAAARTASGDENATPHAAKTASATDSTPSPDSEAAASFFVIHGAGVQEPLQDGVVQVSDPDAPADSPAGPESFVIRGSDVAASGATAEVTPTIRLGSEADSERQVAPVVSDADPIGLPPDDAPAHEDLPPVEPDRGDSPIVVDWGSEDPARGEGPAWITVELQSEPNGAHVNVDGRTVGVTPLQVRLDPTNDHVVRFERDGCGNHVRLLSAAGWERGHSATVTVQLHCP